MKTMVFEINIDDIYLKQIEQYQSDYSMSFRMLFNNMDLIADKNYLNSLKIDSIVQLRVLIKEVIAFNERNDANKEQILENIKKLEERLSKDGLKLKQFRHLQYLKKSYTRHVVFGDKKELIKLSKGNGDLNKWKKSRLRPYISYGEAERYGNRFFDLKKLSSGEVIFKPNKNTKIQLFINTKSHQKILNLLQVLILNKEIPITVQLTTEKLMITYDESILCNTKLDMKKFYMNLDKTLSKEERISLGRQKYIEHENYLKLGKLDRYMSIDLNPDGIGYSILSKNTDDTLNIIDKGFLDISKITDANKRKYETSFLIKVLFKLIKHFKCSYIITEELNIKNKDLGNKISNRKVNNLWNRTLINQIINRRCNETGTIHVEINPVYTSFIGNIMYNEYDPISASLEIGRRGIFKYVEGHFYPEFNTTNFINDKMYDQIKGCQTWKAMYDLFKTSKVSYRRKLKQFNFIANFIGNKKSQCKFLHFL